MEFLIVAVFLGLIPGLIARGKGRSFGLWWFYGFLLFLIALPHALLLKANPEQVERKRTAQGLKKCPFCAEIIKVDAKVCRYCGKEADSSPNLGTLTTPSPSGQKPLAKSAKKVGLVLGGVVTGIVLLAVLGQIGSPKRSSSRYADQPAASSAASTPVPDCPTGTVWSGAGCISQTVKAGAADAMSKSSRVVLPRVPSKPRTPTIGETIGLTGITRADGPVVVWKSFDAQEEGSALAQAGANQALILPYVACIVPAGTTALVRDISILRGGAPTIIILDGVHMGCRGIVHVGNVVNY